MSVCLTDQQCVCMCVSVLIVRVCVCLTDEQCVRVSLAEGQSSDYLMQIHTDAPVNLQHTHTHTHTCVRCSDGNNGVINKRRY